MVCRYILRPAVGQDHVVWREGDDTVESTLFTTDVLTCATCGARRKVLALVQDPSSIQAILQHLGLAPQTGATPTTRPRAPPQGCLDLSTTT